jgi:hypothetical protein
MTLDDDTTTPAPPRLGMGARVAAFGAFLFAVGLLVVAIWLWANAASLSVGRTRPTLSLWAVRLAAVSVAAVAQVIALTVGGRVYRRDVPSDMLRLSGLLIGMLAGVGAIALGLAGR